MKNIHEDGYSQLEYISAINSEAVEALCKIGEVFDPAYDIYKMTNQDLLLAVLNVKEMACVFSVVRRALEGCDSEIKELLEKNSEISEH
ncbi:hypothetical protein [Brochothrix thermosphacta]|uniref:Uncharacterized protein n=1 Tax=Brochothrix thermosphacta TaxID=2756 RepID=A0A2X0QCR0_BROTH|nr:hypothetical protein [Brochothrix thermosphacta]ODJ51085.1 hypothetical protein BFR40_08405 [Brochothrix thermosphacta]ODJ55365.1 hypothetical protein BFR41_06460 [Brochothrix thermosphacta]ODJ59182.1 hypothetical protein BFR42_03880 [Brochothrix thermosphacta]ODJ70613.1 hypothetical protein BFR43_06485 [Brochothrix thermosphacta]SPP25767.1 hypothetical protein BTBSAS_10127 [Brochothrix thermosphacta]